MICQHCGGNNFRKVKMLKGEVEYYVCNRCDWIGDMVENGVEE